ncbi:MAG: hypothetical protein KatS3mg031_1308 [Chitinophagales bacterium]|nr:MAG: hypothetical protein KatS3mg031_1308 [Chitinophagales bacterium]
MRNGFDCLIRCFNVRALSFIVISALFSTGCVLLSADVYAQTFVSRNNSGTSNTTFQLGSTSARKTQQLYTPADLGFPSASGNIDKVYFMYNSTTAQTFTDLEVYIWQTTATSLTTTFLTPPGPANFSGSITIPAGTAGDWFAIPLTTPFTGYDPNQSVVVETRWSTSPTSTSWAVRTGTSDASGTNRKLYTSTVTNTTGTLTTTRANFGFDVVSTAANDAGIVSVDAPVDGTAPGIHNVEVTLRNHGTATLTSVTINWGIGSLGNTYNWTGSLASNSSTTVTLGTYNFSTLGYYVILAQTSNPNGSADANTANDLGTATVKICSALSGAYTINSAATTGGTNFATFAHAADFLNTCGISGPVTFTVQNGPFNESATVVFNNIAGSSSTNTITINGNNRTVNFAATSSSRAVFALNGTQYLTINQLNINSTDATYGWGVQLYNSASNNTISNCNITVPASSTAGNAVGILANGSATSYSTAGANLNNNTFSGNTITGSYHGIYFNGNGTGCTGNVISGNDIKDYYSYGIYLSTLDGALVYQNQLHRPTLSATGGFYGIYMTTDNIRCKVYKNRIYDPYANSTTTTNPYGIYLTGNDAGTSEADANFIYNNLIYSFDFAGTTQGMYGIYNFDNTYLKVFYNTIVFDQQNAPTTTGLTYGYYTSGNTSNAGNEFKNNIVVITKDGPSWTTGTRRGISYGSSGQLDDSDYNVIYISGTGSNNFFGYNGSTGYATQAAWNTATGKDANSKDTSPSFNDPSNDDYTPTATSAGNFATPISTAGGYAIDITDDFFGTARSATNPDPGAIEWTALGLDAAITWVSPSGPTPAGPTTVTVNISNTSSTTITSVNLTYTDGITPVTQNFTGLSLTTGNNVNLNFTTPFNVGTYSELRAYINSVNGITDNSQTNDTTATVAVCQALSGAYTINKGAAASSTNFTSFQAAADRLATCGVSGPVTITVVPGSGPYNEQVTFTTIPGVSATNTVTIQGNGETIRAITNTTDRHVIRLTDVSRLTINNLNITVDPTSTTSGMGVHIYNSGHYISITNCNIDLTGFTSSLFGGVIASASLTSFLTSGDYSNLTITGNTITGGGYGVDVYGGNPGLAGNIVVSNNTIYDFSSNGIYFQSTTGAVISGNTLNKRAGANTTVNAIQIAGSGNVNPLVYNNLISHEHTIGSYRGIYLFGGTGAKIYNNVIYDLRSQTGNMTGIEARVAGEIFFNTISMDDANATTGTLKGFVESLSNLGVILRNNIFSITQPSAGSTGLAFGTSTSSMNSNYNVIYVPSGDVASRGSTAYTTMSDWQNSGYGADANSYSANPFFESATLRRPTNGIINNKGIAYGGVTVDILGNSRVPDYDIGAYQFDPAANDAAISAFVVPSLASSCGATLDVVFTLTNAGTATLTSVKIDWTVNSVSQTQVNWSGSLAGGASTNVTLGTISIANNTLYNFSATSSLPNGVADPNPSNDGFSYSGWRKGFSGSYTINSAAAASGTNYQTFQSIFDDLSAFGVCGAVTINVSNGPYTEHVVINAIPNTSSVNTVTLNGNGQVLQYDATTTSRPEIATLVLSGVNYLTVDNLVINALDANNGYGINIIDGASNLTISNNTINIPLSISSSTAGAGISTAGSSSYLTGTLPPSTNVTISGNTVNGGGNGIIIVGDFPVAERHSDIAVINNTLIDQHAEGIQFLGVTNATVSGNNISRPTLTTTTTYTGIYFWNATENYVIEKNRIHTITSGSSTYGIRVLGNSTYNSSGTIRNNLIYNWTTTGSSSQYGIYDNVSSNATVSIYHNTIVLDDASYSGSGTTRAYYWGTTSNSNVAHPVKNNIFYINRGGTGSKWLIDVTDVDNGPLLDANNNVLFFGPGATGSLYFGELGAAQYTSFAAWQAAGKDVNGLNVNPVFANPGVGNFTPTVSSIDGSGASVGVADDILGNSRASVGPDPGAYEFCVANAWIGTISTDWFTPANWCSGVVPTSTTDVVIPSGAPHFPEITGPGFAEVRDITLNPGGTITVTNVNNAQLRIYGDINNTAAVNMGSGTMVFSKAGTQSLNGPVSFNGLVAIATGATLNTNGNLTLEPGGQLMHGAGSPTYTGNISAHPITMKRVGFNSPRLWNFWGSPLSGVDLSALGQRTHYYDPLLATDPNTTIGLQRGWVPVSGAMQAGIGYISVQAGTVQFIGQADHLNTNPAINVTIKAGSGANGVPYNLLGNPFPSAMSATEFMNVNGPAGPPFFGNGTVTGVTWFWDDDATGGAGYSKTDFAAWSGAGGVAGPNNPSKVPNGHIATGQGFFVEKIDPGTATVTFNNGMRSTTNTVFFRQKPIERLWVNVTNNHGLYNEVLVAFIDDATDGYDLGYDAKKMRGNQYLALYTKIGNADYMIQALSALTTDKTVALGLDAGLAGTYTFGLKALENLDESVAVILEDRMTGTFHNLRLHPTYTFALAAPTQVADRFYLHFNVPLQINIMSESCNGADGQITLVQDGSKKWNYVVTDAQGNLVAKGNDFNGTAFIGNLEDGEYTLQFSDEYGYQFMRSVQIDGKQMVQAAFTMSQPAVLAGETIQFTNLSTGAQDYEWDFGDGTVVTDTINPVHTYAEPGTYVVKLRARNADCYSNMYATIEVLKQTTTGIGGTAEEELKIYGHHQTIYVNLNMPEAGVGEVAVYDVLGQEVYTSRVSTQGRYKIHLTAPAAGQYFVKVTVHNKIQVVKVMLGQ